MTETTDVEAAEALWASSEEGRAAVRAGWDKADEIGLRNRFLSMADVAAIVYAAIRAVEPPGEAPAAHEHDWAVLGAREVPPAGNVFGKPLPRTAVLGRCRSCGQPCTWLLDGTWTPGDFTGGGPPGST